LPQQQKLKSLRLRAIRSARFFSRGVRRHRMRLLQYIYPRGALPDFLIIGAMKCGTSTLFQMLTQHPGFVPPIAKEITYFNNPGVYRHGERWYRAHFPSERVLQRHARFLGYRPVTGEATPAMSVPMYAENAARMLPHARLVVTLRNPVDRAYSHYQHMLHHMIPERLEFRAALERESALLDAGLSITRGNFSEQAPLLLRFGYLNRGRYALELEYWLRYFPRDQFLFLNFDAWERQPEDAAARVARHVGLPEHRFKALQVNKGVYRQPLPEDCSEWLTDYYRPWNKRLFTLLGEDWGWPC